MSGALLNGWKALSSLILTTPMHNVSEETGIQMKGEPKFESRSGRFKCMTSAPLCCLPGTQWITQHVRRRQSGVWSFRGSAPGFPLYSSTLFCFIQAEPWCRELSPPPDSAPGSPPPPLPAPLGGVPLSACLTLSIQALCPANFESGGRVHSWCRSALIRSSWQLVWGPVRLSDWPCTNK